MKKVTKIVIGAAVIGTAIFAYKVWKNYMIIHTQNLSEEEIREAGEKFVEGFEAGMKDQAEKFDEEEKPSVYISDKEFKEAQMDNYRKLSEQYAKANHNIKTVGDVMVEFDKKPHIFVTARESSMYRAALVRGYEILSLTLLADDTLLDEDNEKIRNIYDILPEDYEKYFEEPEEAVDEDFVEVENDVIYVIHKLHNCIYEVVKDERDWETYKETFHISDVDFFDHEMRWLGDEDESDEHYDEEDEE